MLLIQILLVIFFLFAFSKVVGRYQAREISARAAVFWMFFWILAGVIVLLPDSTFYAARLVGVGRGVDLVIYVSLAAIFFIIFRLLVKINRMNKDITTLTRTLALREEKKQKPL